MSHSLFLHWTPAAESGASEEESATGGRNGGNGGSGKRKMRLQDIPEEAGITAEFAEKLDLSCMAVGRGAVKPPSIENGYVVKFNRWDLPAPD